MLNPPDDRDRLLKPGEIALLLSISRTQAYRLLRSEIPCLHIGASTIRVKAIDLERYLADHRDAHGQDLDRHE